MHYLSFSLQTLSLSLDPFVYPCLSPILSLHFPNLKRLVLASFRLNNTSEAMSFWRRHPNLEKLNLSPDDPGLPWFSDDSDIIQGLLPNLIHLEVRATSYLNQSRQPVFIYLTMDEGRLQGRSSSGADTAATCSTFHTEFYQEGTPPSARACVT